MEKKSRDMNFELLRIVAMLLIVSSHYIINSDLLKELVPFSFNYIFIDVVRVLTRISVNLYVLITGYYMITSKIKIKKLFSIWINVMFYSIVMLIISTFIVKVPNIKDIIKAIMPISSGLYWFATTYVALYVLAPFINKLIHSLNRKQYLILLTILFILLVVVKTIFNNNGYIESKNGKSLIWFTYLYIFAGYIRLYYNRKTNKTVCLLVPLLIPFVITFIRIIAIKYLGKEMSSFFDFSNILNFISTICLFLYFREVKIQNKIANKIIGKISPLMFGIYLIHENPYINLFMWKQIIGVYKYATSPYLVFHFIICVILVFCACGIIESIRIKLFDIGKRTKGSKKIDKKLDELNEKFWTVMEEQT